MEKVAVKKSLQPVIYMVRLGVACASSKARGHCKMDRCLPVYAGWTMLKDVVDRMILQEIMFLALLEWRQQNCSITL